MVFGSNLTDPGADSNGSGKSGLLEGINLAFTGKTCRDVDRTQFINDDADQTDIILELENNNFRIKDLKIHRKIHRKRAAKVEIWENGELNKELTSVNESNSRIYELIGITKEDLLSFFLIGQDTNYSFLSSSDVEQKKIIARLTNADIINEKLDNLKERKKSKDVVKSELTKSVDKFNNFIELTEESIEDELKNGSKEIKDNIKKLKEEKNENLTLMEESSKKIKSKNKTIEEYKLLVVKNKEKIVDVSKIERKIQIKKSKVRNLRSEISEGLDLISELKRIQNGKTTCPDCKFEWNEGEEIDLKTIPKLIKQTESLNEVNKRYKEKAENQINELKPKLDINDEIEERIDDLESDIDDLESDVKISERKLKRLESDNKQLDSSISKMKSSLDENSKVDSLKVKLKEYESNLKLEQLKLDKISKECDDIDYWIYHFSKKGFLTFLTNKSIKTIEGATNTYLKKFNTDLQVSIDGYTVLKSKEIREKINVSIVRNGVNIGSFERYSGGERGRINLACIVGLQKLMNMSAVNGGLNFLGLDEVFEGLDTTGQKDVLNILESLGVTTMVVSHRSDPIGAENEIFIDKIKGISKIRE